MMIPFGFALRLLWFKSQVYRIAGNFCGVKIHLTRKRWFSCVKFCPEKCYRYMVLSYLSSWCSRRIVQPCFGLHDAPAHDLACSSKARVPKLSECACVDRNLKKTHTWWSTDQTTKSTTMSCKCYASTLTADEDPFLSVDGG